MCSMFTQRSQRDWCSGLQAVVFSYNTSIHPSTGFLMIFEVFWALECSLSLKIKSYNYFEIFSVQVLNSIRAQSYLNERKAFRQIFKTAIFSKSFQQKADVFPESLFLSNGYLKFSINFANFSLNSAFFPKFH
jgi:hypothetical protein